MHSSSTGPSDSERSSGLPCMRWPLQGLRRLWVVLLSVPPPLESSRGGVRSSVGGSGSSGRPRWSRVGSAVAYTPAEVRALTPVRESVEKRALLPDLRDVFLCHAWDDRRGPAKELHDLLELSVFRSGSARRTSSSALHCCAKSTRDWRSHESGSWL